MPIHAGHANVTSTSGEKVASRAARRQVYLVYLGNGPDVYYGESGVTAGSGALLLGTDGNTSPVLETTAAIHAVVASGSANISFMEVYD